MNSETAASCVAPELLSSYMNASKKDQNALVRNKVTEKYSLSGRQIIVYLREVPAEQPVTMKYRLMARFPIKAKTAKSIAYEYYDPGVRDEAPPQEILVKAK